MDAIVQHQDKPLKPTTPRAIKGLAGRFWNFVSPEPNTGCWIWTGGERNGYGAICLNRGAGTVGAHRVSWELRHGPIPAGAIIRHCCDNRWCVNPDHLLSGSQKDNIADMMNRQRFTAPAGARNGQAKLTAERVAYIRHAIAGGGRGTATALARKFGVSLATISMIKSHRRWVQENKEAPCSEANR